MPTVRTPSGKHGSGEAFLKEVSGRRPALIGRNQELAIIEDAVSALGRAQHVPVLAMTGEAGIGKSRLLMTVGDLGEAASHVVLRGRAAEFERSLPFGVFVDAVDHHLSSVDAEWSATMSEDAIWELRHTFPALPVNLDTDQPTLVAERYRTHRAVRALLETLAVERPLVVLLDDVHWADPASVELLCHLLRHPPRGPVLLALTLRRVPAMHVLLGEIAAAVRQGRCTVLELGPLTASECAQLVAAHGSRATLPQIFAESGGNPFFIEQLTRSGRADLDPRPDAMELGEAGLPTAVVAALDSELRALPSTARTMVRGAAVAGDPFEQDLATAAADIDEPAGLLAVDVLVEHQLVIPTTEPRRFRFRHPIIRRAIYESTGPGWRLAAHARVAAALVASGAGGPTLAHHLEMSARRGDEDAISSLVASADSVASRAPASAARWYEAALRLLPDTAEHVQRRLHLFTTAAMARRDAGQLNAAHAHLRSALDIVAPGTEMWLTLVSACAGVEALLGRHDQGQTRLLDALGALGGESSPAVAVIKLELSAAGVYAGDFSETKRWAGEVLASTYAPRPALLATAKSLLAVGHYALGEIEQASQMLEKASAAFDGLTDDAVAERIDNAHWLVLAENGMERFADAVRHCERGIAVSRRHGRGDWIGGIMHFQVAALAATGRLQEALDLAETTVDAARLALYPLGLSVALWELSATACLAGDLGYALDAAEESVEAAASLARGGLTAMPGLVLGRACLELGEPVRARAEVLAAGGGPDLPLLFGVSKLSAYETLARAELAVGALDAADHWAKRAEAILSAHSLPLETVVCRRARASVLLAAGDSERAAELALDAAQAAAVAPIEQARCRIVAGRALSRTGAKADAITQLTQAQQQLATCGASRYRDEAAAELRRLGRRARRNPPYSAGPQSLTDREREIAELVTAGMTNRQIAARCFISEKTVEAILSKTFAKLGVPNRAALSREIASRAAPDR